MILKDRQMRYDRQIILPEIGEEGQKKLQEAKVLIVGVGAVSYTHLDVYKRQQWHHATEYVFRRIRPTSEAIIPKALT